MEEDEGALSFDPAPAQEEGLSITPPNIPAPVSDRIASDRAKAFNFALKGLSPGTGVLRDQILDAQEESIRDSHAVFQQARNNGVATDIIKDIAKRGVVTTGALDFVSKVTGAKVNPSVGIENSFAKNFVDHTITNNENEVFGKPLTSADLYGFLRDAEISQDLIARKQTTKGLLQDIEDRWEQSPFYNKALDIGGGLIPFNSWYKILTAKTSGVTSSILPGNSLEEQVQYLRGLPIDQMKAKAREAIEDLAGRNMHSAVEFARALDGYSTDQKFLDNAMGVADVLTTFPLKTFGKLAGLAIGAAKRGGKEVAEEVAKEAPLMITDQRPKQLLLTDQRPKDQLLLTHQYTPNFELVPEHESRWRLYQQRQMPRPQDTQYHLDELPTLGPDRSHVASELRMGDEGPVYERTFFSKANDPMIQMGDEGPIHDPRAWSPREPEFTFGSPTEADLARLGDEGPVRDRLGHRDVAPDTRNTIDELRMGDEGPMAEKRIPSMVSKRDPEISMSDEGPIYEKKPVTGRGWQFGEPTQHQFKNKEGLTTVTPEARAQAEAERRIALRDAVKAQDAPTPEAALEQIGDIPGSAAMGAAKEVRRRVVENDPTGTMQDLFQIVPAFMNPRVLFNEGINLAREMQQRTINALEQQGIIAMRALDPIKVQRLSEQAELKAVQDTQAGLKNYYRNLNDAILETGWNRPDTDPSGAGSVFLLLGKTDGNAFVSRAEALQGARNYGIAKDSDVYQRGTAFYVRVTTPVRETTDGVLQLSSKTTDNLTPISTASSWIGWLRSADDLVSHLNKNNRIVATTAPQETLRYMQEMAKPVGKLSKASSKAVQRMLEINRDMPNPNLPGERGWFYQTQGEWEQAFQQAHRRLPSPQESLAYWTAIKVNDFDWIVRNLGVHRDLARQGVEDIQVGQSGWFKGRRETELPWNDPEDATILYIDGNGEKHILQKHAIKDSPIGKEVKDAIKEKGFKIVQVADTLSKPLKDFSQYDDIINFVVTKSHDRRMMGYKQIDYRPGGHVMYPDGWWVKQPMLGFLAGGKTAYYGDKTILNFRTEAEARKYAQAMNIAREMRNQGNAGLDAYLQQNLPWTRQEFDSLFNSGALATDRPIAVSYSGRSTLDTVPGLRESLQKDLKAVNGFVDHTTSKYNLYRSVDRSLTADRDNIAQTIAERTGQNNQTMYSLENARQLDPYSALQRGMADVVRSRWMNDYKYQTTESFVNEFADVLVNPDKAKLNPLKALYDKGALKNSVPPNLQDKLAAAKNYQRAALQFIGQQSEFGKDIASLENRLQNWIYERFGQKGLSYTPEHLIGFISDPAHYARAVAFHMKLGLFNPVQLILQAQSMNNVLGMAGPRDGIPAWVAGAIESMYMRRTDKVAHFDYADKMAHTFGMGVVYKPGQFKDASLAYRRTGFGNVGGETAYRDDVFDPKIWKSGKDTFLDKGAFFFNEGERLVRNSAWHAAAREWQRANPGRLLAEATDRELGRVLKRADTMAVNMTRASNASWQQGLFSIPTQFLAFNARMAEQFLGNKLTQMERIRLMSIYSMMYGVPTAAAAVAGIYPLHEDLRKEAISRGYNMDNWITKAFTDGIPQMLVAQLTGVDPNIAQRLGPGGGSFLKDIIRGDKGVAEIAFGASGKTMKDIISTASPLFGNMLSFLDGSNTLTASDWTDVARNISTFENMHKAWFAMSAGKYFTKRDLPVDNVSGMEAFWIAMGMTPQRISDMYLKRELAKDQQQYQTKIVNEMSREMSRAMKSLIDGDMKKYEAYMKRYSVLWEAGDFNPSDYASVFRKTIKNENQMDKAERNFIKHAPGSLFKPRLDNLIKGEQ